MQDQALETSPSRGALPLAILARIKAFFAALPGVWREHGHWLLPVVPLLILLYTPVVWASEYWFTAGSPFVFQPLIPFLVGYALWDLRSPIFAYYNEILQYPANSPKRRGRGGLTVIIVGSIFMLLTYATKTPSFSIAAFVLIVFGTVYHVYGRAVFLYILPHLFFLLLFIPPPATLLVFLIHRTQNAMASVIGDLSAQMGTPGKAIEDTIIFKVHGLDAKLLVSPAASGLSVVASLVVLGFWLAVWKRCEPGRGSIVVGLGTLLAFLLCVSRLLLMGWMVRAGMEDSSLLHGIGEMNPWLLTVPCYALTYWVSKRFNLWS